MTKKVVVVGSGFGGLASALRLRAKGYDVTLLEKHSDLGGRARVFKKDGFIYDGGPTVITAPYLFEELFSLFNKKISNYVKIVPLNLWYRFIFNDGKTFDYSGDEASMEKEIKNFQIPILKVIKIWLILQKKFLIKALQIYLTNLLINLLLCFSKYLLYLI